jgi:putative transposase
MEKHLCSIRTKYRILEQASELRERREQRHPNRNRSYWLPARIRSGVLSHVIPDVFSRYVVGWMVAECESAELAKRLIGETGRKQNIAPDQLTE